MPPGVCHRGVWTPKRRGQRPLRASMTALVVVVVVGYPSTMVSISVEKGLLLDLEKLAAKLGRPLESMTAEALRSYVEITGQLVDDIAASREQLARGEGIAIDDVDAALERRRAAKQR